MGFTISESEIHTLFIVARIGLRDQARVASDQVEDLKHARGAKDFEDPLYHLEIALELCRLLRRMSLRLQRVGCFPTGEWGEFVQRPPEQPARTTFTLSIREARLLLTRGTAGLVIATAFLYDEAQGLESMTSRAQWRELVPKLTAIGNGAPVLWRLYQYLQGLGPDPMYTDPLNDPA